MLEFLESFSRIQQKLKIKITFKNIGLKEDLIAKK